MAPQPKSKVGLLVILFLVVALFASSVFDLHHITLRRGGGESQKTQKEQGIGQSGICRDDQLVDTNLADYESCVRSIRLSQRSDFDEVDTENEFVMGHEPNATMRSIDEYRTLKTIFAYNQNITAVQASQPSPEGVFVWPENVVKLAAETTVANRDLNRPQLLLLDELFPPYAVSHRLSPRGVAYSHIAITVHAPAFLLSSFVQSAVLTPSASFWGSWLAHVMLDASCRVVQASSYLLPMQQAQRRNQFAELWNHVLPTVARECNAAQLAARQGANDHRAPLAVASASRLKEYVHCVNELMAYGDLSFHLQCFGRLWAMFPSQSRRSKVIVLLAMPPAAAPIARNFYDNLIVKYFLAEDDKLQRPKGGPAFGVRWMPLDHIMVVEDGHVIVPSKVPADAVVARSWLRRVLAPRVMQHLARRHIPKHSRIALISVGANTSVTNRSFRESDEFNKRLIAHGFAVLPPDSPLDERMYYLAHAKAIIASHGSNSHMLQWLAPNPSKLPKIMSIVHSGYYGETPFSHKCRGQRTCGPLLVAPVADRLDDVSDDDITAYLAQVVVM